MNIQEAIQEARKCHLNGDLKSAANILLKIIEIQPSYLDAWQCLGTICLQLHNYDLAISCFKEILRFDPNNISINYNLGLALEEKGHPEESISCYEKILASNPDDSNVRSRMIYALLLSGNLQKGWEESRKEYEIRLRKNKALLRDLWNGATMNKRRVFIHGRQQGFGDTIQFIRYIPLVSQCDARVIVECKQELKTLINTVEGVDYVISEGEQSIEFDKHCPLLNLPFIFKTTLQTIPQKIPYVFVDPILAEKWINKLSKDKSRLKIGLAWAGNPQNPRELARSFQLNTFSPLSKISDTIFYSLQKGKAAKQVKASPQGMKIVDYTDELKNFTYTAALIENLDLVIAADTVVVHLAGALGKPVWTLLPYSPDWRWLLNREDSPWYPTMRLFRQPAPGDWESVIAKVKDELLKLLGSH